MVHVVKKRSAVNFISDQKRNEPLLEGGSSSS
jgi:hypothetical protein